MYNHSKGNIKQNTVIAKKTWTITSERYVAYFDIMGFKAMIAKDKGTSLDFMRVLRN